MASVQELIALADHEARVKNPGASALQGLLVGMGQAQNNGLERAKTLIALDENRRMMERQAEMDKQIREEIEAGREASLSRAHRDVAGGGRPVLPSQKLKVEISQDSSGRYSRKFTTEEPKVAESLDAVLARRVQAGEMTLEAALEAKAKSQGVSPGLAYQKEKDDEKRKLELQELQIPGYELGTEVRPTTSEAKDLRTGVAAMNDFVNGVDRLSALIKEHGASEFAGKEAGEMETLAANLKLTLKEVQKLGVLSASDIAFLNAQVFDPTTLKSLGTTTPTALKQLETVKNRAKSGLNESLKTRGYKAVGGAGPKAGDVEDGYTFKGGDPSDPNNWEKA